MRNQLSHVPLKKDMLIDEKAYFTNIYAMVTCLEKLYPDPQHFDATNLREKLEKVGGKYMNYQRI